jgi:hypothetical protein
MSQALPPRDDARERYQRKQRDDPDGERGSVREVHVLEDSVEGRGKHVAAAEGTAISVRQARCRAHAKDIAGMAKKYEVRIRNQGE